jgi:hypothetical protein
VRTSRTLRGESASAVNFRLLYLTAARRSNQMAVHCRRRRPRLLRITAARNTTLTPWADVLCDVGRRGPFGEIAPQFLPALSSFAIRSARKIFRRDW